MTDAMESKGPKVLHGLLATVLCVFAATAAAQEQRYITDEILVPIRSGAGGDYRILNKGLPSGTALTFFGLSEDGVWADVETRGGTRGWLRAQYIQIDPPTQQLLEDLQQQYYDLQADRDKLRGMLNDSQSMSYDNEEELIALRQTLTEKEAELTEIKRISGSALDLDARNRNLSEQLETERSEAELLKLENVRLQERIDNNQIMDGAVAVLLGVLVAIIAPRLVPKRRRNDGWS